MNRPILTVTAAIAALVLSGCGGSGSAATTQATASPSHTLSAAGACADFQKWAQQFSDHSKMADVTKMGMLLLAEGGAPSGQLYSDLNTLAADVITASKATGSLASAEELAVVNDATTVQQDCQSVNPAS
jgi:hypothetical protein